MTQTWKSIAVVVGIVIVIAVVTIFFKANILNIIDGALCFIQKYLGVDAGVGHFHIQPGFVCR